MLFNKLKVTAALTGLANTDGKSAWTVDKGSIDLVIQAASVDDNPLMEGDFTRQHVGYVKNATSIAETDRLVVTGGEFDGIYKIRSISTYAALSYMPHRKLLLEKIKS